MKIEIKNKKKFGIILSIVLVLVAMASGTYALLYNENVASNREDYTTGMLSIVAKSKSDNINLTNALPMSDEEGILTEPYVFTIENVGNLDYNFNIRLLSTSDNPINPEYIKLKIDDGEVTTLSNLTNSIIKENITLKAKEVMDVSIRIWLSSDTPNSEIGKSFNSKIVTEGQAIYTELNNEGYINLVQHITNLYNNAEKTVVTSDAEHVCTENDKTGKCTNYNVTKTIDYNYASSVGLMNDRLGGTTESLDGGNIRYYGADPNNFIDIGERDEYGHTYLWRIIGVFDGKIRIVRRWEIGRHSWDSSSPEVNNGNGVNEWSQADLMKLLNPGYEDNKDTSCSNCKYNSTTHQYDCNCVDNVLVNNSLWYNGKSGTCYNNSDSMTGTCGFNVLPNSAKNRIIDQTIYLGGGANSFSYSSIYTNQAYELERGNELYQNSDDGVTRTTTWIGKVALMYPSDIGYASDLNICRETLNNYHDCYFDNKSNWLGGYDEWLITPYTLDASGVWHNSTSGIFSGGSASRFLSVRPVLTLASESLMDPKGDGSENNPYVLK